MLLQTKDYQHFQILDEESGNVLNEFDGAKLANRCLPGDIVSETVTLVKRAAIPLLVGTIQIQSKYLFGYTAKNVPIYQANEIKKNYL